MARDLTKDGRINRARLSRAVGILKRVANLVGSRAYLGESVYSEIDNFLTENGHGRYKDHLKDDVERIKSELTLEKATVRSEKAMFELSQTEERQPLLNKRVIIVRRHNLGEGIYRYQVSCAISSEIISMSVESAEDLKRFFVNLGANVFYQEENHHD